MGGVWYVAVSHYFSFTAVVNTRPKMWEINKLIDAQYQYAVEWCCHAVTNHTAECVIIIHRIIHLQLFPPSPPHPLPIPVNLKWSTQNIGRHLHSWPTYPLRFRVNFHLYFLPSPLPFHVYLEWKFNYIEWVIYIYNTPVPANLEWNFVYISCFHDKFEIAVNIIIHRYLLQSHSCKFKVKIQRNLFIF